MEGRLDVETSNRPCGRISRSLAFAATGKGEAWTRHSKGPKPLRRTPMSNSPARRERPPVLNPLNRRIRTRMSGGVGGGSREVSPYPDYHSACAGRMVWTLRSACHGGIGGTKLGTSAFYGQEKLPCQFCLSC